MPRPASSPYVTTTYPMLYVWTNPIGGRNRRGTPCKVVKRSSVIQDWRVTVEFTDGTQAETSRQAIRQRKWVVDVGK